MKLFLAHNEKYAWQGSEKFHVKGFGFDPNGNYLHEGSLLKYIEQHFDLDNPESCFRNFNGFFSGVILLSNSILLIPDKLQTFPLFYWWHKDEWWIGDDAQLLAEKVNSKNLSVMSATEMMVTDYISGNDTLHEEIKQTQAGRIFQLFPNGELKIKPYFRHSIGRKKLGDEAHQLHKLKTAADATFARLIASSNNRTLAIPLSGGLDSRFILAMLVKMQYPNIVTYTYGKQDSFEVRIAQEVAQKLRVTWHFIEYKDTLLESYFEPQAVAFQHFAGRMAFLPHEQDYFALKYLKDHHLIPEDTIMVPGYCGDFLAGSYIPSQAELQAAKKDISGIIDFIYGKYYKKYQLPLQAKLASQFTIEPQSTEEWINLLEEWFIINRVVKYIVNAVRNYEFFGYEWRMPLWDDEWMQVWYDMPLEYRLNKNLYRTYLQKELFNELNISEEAFAWEKVFTHKGVMSYVRKNTPSWIKTVIKPFIYTAKVQNMNNLTALTALMASKLNIPSNVVKPVNINKIEALWYFSLLNTQFYEQHKKQLFRLLK